MTVIKLVAKLMSKPWHRYWHWYHGIMCVYGTDRAWVRHKALMARHHAKMI